MHVEFSRLADDLRKAEIKGCSFKPDLITPMFRENMQTKVLVRLLDRFESEYVFFVSHFFAIMRKKHQDEQRAVAVHTVVPHVSKCETTCMLLSSSESVQKHHVLPHCIEHFLKF